MDMETALTIVNALTQEQRAMLEKAQWRYLAFSHAMLEAEHDEQAKEDRKAFPEFLEFNTDGLPTVSGKNAADFMAAVTGMPRNWCEAWDTHDFYETQPAKSNLMAELYF